MGYFDNLKQQQDSIKPQTNVMSFSEFQKNKEKEDIQKQEAEKAKVEDFGSKAMDVFQRATNPFYVGKKFMDTTTAGTLDVAKGVLGAGKMLVGGLEQQSGYKPQTPIWDRSQEANAANKALYTAAKQVEPSGKAYQSFDKPMDFLQSTADDISSIWKPKTKFGEILQSTIRSLPTTAAGLAISSVASPIAGGAFMGASSSGQEFGSATQQGARYQDAAKSAVVTGLGETATEALSLGFLDDILKKPANSAIKRGLKYLRNIAQESIGEGSSEVISFLGRKATYDKDGELDWGQVGEAAASGALMSLFFGGLGEGNAAFKQAAERKVVTEQDMVNGANELGLEVNNIQELEQALTRPDQFKSVNKMTDAEYISELESKGIKVPNTKADRRKAVIASRTTQNQDLAVQQAQDDTFVPQQEQEAQIGLDEATMTPEEQQVASILNDVDSIESADTAAKFLLDQENKGQLKMNLQFFAKKLAQDIEIINGIRPFEPRRLTALNRALTDLQRKGNTKATYDTFLKLADGYRELNQFKKEVPGMLAEARKSVRDKMRAENKRRKLENDAITSLQRLSNGKLMPESMAMIEEIKQNVDLKAKSMTQGTRLKLEAIDDAIQKMKEDGIDIPPSLEASVSRLRTKKIADMTDAELESYIETAKAIATKNIQERELITGSDAVYVNEKSEAVINDTKKTIKKVQGEVGTLNYLLKTGQATLKNLFMEAGGGVDSSTYEIYKDLQKAENKEYSIVRDLNKTMEEVLGDDYFDIVNSKEFRQKQNVNGRILSSGEKISLKMMLMDPDIMRSIDEYGYMRSDERNAKPVTREYLESLELNDVEQKIADGARKLFEKAYEFNNPAHIELNLTPLKQVEGEYFPKNIHKASRKVNPEVGGNVAAALNEISSTTERTGADGIIELIPIEQVLRKHISDTAKYAAYAKQFRLTNKIMRNIDVDDAFSAKFGSRNGQSVMSKYVENYMLDALGKPHSSRFDFGGKWFDKLQKNIGGSILSLRATTPLVQPASYFMASNISTKNRMKSLKKVFNLKDTIKEMHENNPRAYIRQHIGIDPMSDTSNALTEMGMAAIHFMDQRTIGHLWEASKLEAAETVDPNSEGYMDKVNEIFDEALDSQPNYTTLERSDIMRSRNPLVKAMTLFGSAKASAVNELRTAFNEGQSTGDWKRMARASSGYIGSILYMAGIRALFKNLKGDDVEEGKLLAETAIGAIPMLDQIYGLTKGYEMGPVSYDAINDVANKADTLFNISVDYSNGEATDEEYRRAVIKFAESATKVMGIPVENAVDIVEYATNAITLNPYSKTATKVRQFTDPYTQSYTTAIYSDIASQVDKGNYENAFNLVEIMRDIGVKEENMMKSLKNRVKKDELNRYNLREFENFLDRR